MACNSSNLSSKISVTGPKSSHSSGGLWLLQTSPTRSPNHLAINEHRLTTDNCSDHFPGEPTAEVRADPAAGLKVLRVKRPLFLGIHDRQIRIATNRESSLAWVQPEELRRGRCGEMGYAFERQAARVHALGHENRQCRLNAGDAAPCLPNILVSPGLVGGGAGRMIRADQVDAPREYLLPQRIARRRVSNRWGAFQRRADALEVRSGEGEVVRAGLRRDRDTLAASRVHGGEALATAHMHHVDPHIPARAARAHEQPPDRVDLRLRRPDLAPGEPVV